MSTMQTRQALQKAMCDYQHCQARLATCYTYAQRQSIVTRLRQLQYKINYLSVKLRNEQIADRRRYVYKQQVARQRAYNATYRTMKPRGGY